MSIVLESCARDEQSAVIVKKVCGCSPKRNPMNIHVVTLPNRKCPYTTVEEKKEAEVSVLEATLKNWQNLLPDLFRQFAKIKDGRKGGFRYKKGTILLCGLLLFIIQCESRREANREITGPEVLAVLKLFLPDIEGIPHYDTVANFLKKLAPGEVEKALTGFIQTLLRKKKLFPFLIERGYVVAIDGSGKHSGNCDGAKYQGKALVRKRKDGTTYLVYVLEAVLVSPHGIQLPIMAEFCENEADFEKQDCERKAFYRLAHRLKKEFSKLPIIIVADSLYACGPVVQLCRKFNWDFMIVVKRGSLEATYDEALRLMEIAKNEDFIENKHGERSQTFHWANDVAYDFKDSDNHKYSILLNFAKSYETWQETKKDGTIEQKETTWVWLSNKRITSKNVVRRCNLIGRSRWGIETNFDVEKNDGYCFEHVFSKDWNAMLGWHALLRIAHVLNTLTLHAVNMWETVKEKGFKGTIKFIKKLLTSYLLDEAKFSFVLEKRYQLRLVAHPL